MHMFATQKTGFLLAGPILFAVSVNVFVCFA